MQMDSSGVPMAIGEPIGGGMFVSNVVLAAVVLASPGKRVVVEHGAFLRDSCFYLGGACILGCITWDSKVCTKCELHMLMSSELDLFPSLCRVAC
jgi:Ca2+/Na+ antiporter